MGHSSCVPNVMLVSQNARFFTKHPDKNGNKSDFSNYRPSLQSQFSKILENLFNERLQQFLITNNILSNSQYGIRAHMSTVHAALELIESISNSIDCKQHCAGVFIDLKKAFDTVITNY